MTPEQLKASILQMAIQGKLVEQRTEEGTADELLDKIYAIKKQLIKEKIIKKQKALEPVREDEIPFDIPTSWKWVKWGDVVNIVSARRVHQSDWKKEGIPFYRAREIAEMARTNGVVDNELYISEELFEEFSASGIPQAGDIMVTAVGTLGKTYIVKETDKFYYKDASVICFENRYGMCPEYLSMMMQTPLMLQQIKSNSEGTTVSTLTMVRMVEYLFPLPPVDEQHRIVAKIEELLPYVDRYAEAYEKLEQFNAKFPEDMKKSILQYAIQGKLVEQRPEEGTAEELYKQIQEEKQKLIKEGKIKTEKPLAEITEDEIPFDIPETWKWVRLPEVGEFARGKSKHRPRNDRCLYEGGGYPFIQTGDVAQTDFKISKWTTEYNEKGLAQSRLWKKGTLCLTIAANIGDVAILDFDACFPDSVVGFNAYKPIGDNKFFLYGLICYKTILDKMSRSTAQKNINLDILSNVAFPLPPIKEQIRIVDRIEELLPYIVRLLDRG